MTVSGPPAYWRNAWVTSNIDTEFGVAVVLVTAVSGNEWITWASLPTVIFTRPPKPSFGCWATCRPNWRSAIELFSRSNTRVVNAAWFLSECVYPASIYPLTLIPEASRTLSRVGAGAGLAWARTVAGAANSAETAEARISFFIVGPFVGVRDQAPSARPVPDFLFLPINELVHWTQ